MNESDMRLSSFLIDEIGILEYEIANQEELFNHIEVKCRVKLNNSEVIMLNFFCKDIFLRATNRRISEIKEQLKKLGFEFGEEE